jgi:DNA-binding LacI/PurR family transcriptional regulator
MVGADPIDIRMAATYTELGERSPDPVTAMVKRITLKEVAARAHVSYQTVSKVLNQQMQVSTKTEARIWKAVRALGYRPDHRARNLRTQRSHMLGYSWTPAPPDQANSILDQFLQSMMDTAEQAGYHLLPFPHWHVDDPIVAYRELMHTGRVDGFILSSVEFNDPRIIFLQQQNFPFVAFGRANRDWDFPYVDVDGAAGLRLTTEHLLERGHRRIAALAWPRRSRVGQDRLAGYMRAMKDAGIAPRREWIARGAGRVSFGYEATARWLALPRDQRPTAIVALNDAMAIGAMRAAQEHGLRVGTDIAITGFDDAPMVQYLTPPLTSVRQPIWEVGQHVLSMLVGMLHGEPLVDQHILLTPQLIVRASSGGQHEGASATDERRDDAQTNHSTAHTQPQAGIKSRISNA